MKPSDAEIQEIESNVTSVPTMFGKEPMVKMPRRLYDRLIARYKLADTLERLYHDYESKTRTLKIRVDELKAEVDFLKKKVQQFTDFIEAKGLVEAFKEFLTPKPIKEKLIENLAKAKVKQDADRKTIPDIKKKRTSVR